MGDIGRRIIGITGAPGSWINQVAIRLEGKDCAVMWPDQKFISAEDERLYNANHENPEVARINDRVITSCHMTRFSGDFPVFYDPPFPGPQEVVNKFPSDQNILIVDTALCLLWGLWGPYITDLIVVEAGEDITTKYIQKWIDGNMGAAECARLRDLYYNRLEECTSTFDSVYRIDNAAFLPDAHDNSWVFHQVGLSDVLDKFLNSGIEATDG